MTAPTPGPWTTGADPTRVESEHEHGWANDGWIICDCKGPDAVANARLIAAAPELLAALKLAYDWSRFVAASGMTNTEEFIAELFERGEAVQEAARAAIKKAEGGSNG